MPTILHARPTDETLVWRPQAGPQKALVDCPQPEVFYGGGRGGGKTDGVLGKWALKQDRYGADFNAIMFRRTTVSAEDAIERSKQIYGPLGARFNEQKLRWRFPKGGRMAFAYLDKVDDANEYQGRNVTDAWVEETGQFPDPRPVDRLFGVLRSAGGVPTQLIITANPGGPGQSWLRSRYRLHPFPKRPKIFVRELANGGRHEIAVIPSRLTDNKILLARDPAYADRLHLVGSAALVRAWLDGDWSAIEGAFFELWDETRHVVDPFTVPEHWTRFRSMDWGFAKPFSVGWWAVASEPTHALGGNDTPVLIPRGALVRYREWYGSNGEPNVGLRLEAEMIAKGIRQRELIGRDERGRETYEAISYGVLDPSAFAQSGQAYGYKGPTIAERMAMTGAVFRAADNSRVAKLGALGGWDQVRSRLRGDLDGNPMLVVFSTCTDLIRTLPVMQHDRDNPEDMDTDGEDHSVDECRYACLSRPWARATPQQSEPQSLIRRITIREMADSAAAKRRNQIGRI